MDWVVIIGGFLGILIIIGLLAAVMTFFLNREFNKFPPTMTMRFTVGAGEKHVVDVSYKQLTEYLLMHVDGAEWVNKWFAAGFRLARSIEFTVGFPEEHTLRVTKKRRLVSAWLYPQQFWAYVDGELVSEATSDLRGPTV